MLPKITMNDVEEFVVSEKAPKSGLTKGYKFFCEGFIHEFQVATQPDNTNQVYLRSKCFKSLKKNEDPHQLQICLLSKTGVSSKVIQHSCSCKAGQGICNHKTALLFQAAHYSLLNFTTVPVIPF
ncbi:hypothetical protein QZH41_020566 [Actinostola sp. cb2023]|nr:hypothetical protein QZH41_020566 [Actinostola sp. cb2023]